jgi:hypothetical protein
VLPEIVAGPDTMLKLTGKLEEAVAVTVKGALPNVLFARAAKLMV